MKSKILRFLDIAVEHLIYGVIFFIPISITLVGTFAGMAIVFFLCKTIISQDLSAIKSNKILFLFLLLFFIFMSLSLFNSGELIAKSVKALLIKWGRFFLLLWAITGTFRDTRRIVKAVYVLLFSATLVGLSVLSQKLFGWEFLRGRVSSYEIMTGPFKNQNGLAAYLSCIVPIPLSLCLWKWRVISVRLYLFVMTGMLVVSSRWTNCRGGWLGVIAGILFLALVVSCRHIKKWVKLLTALIFVFSMPLIGITLYFYQNRNDGDRFIFARGAWGMIKENPFLGKGLGTFMDYCAQYVNNYSTSYAHNCYLQIWAESGIFSLFSFLLFVGYVFHRSVKISLKISGSLNYYILTGLIAGLFGFLVHSFFEVHLYSFQLSFLFWILLGLTVALSSSLEQGIARGKVNHG